MSMVPHVEARESFQFELGKILKRACQRWQTWRDGVNAEELRHVEMKMATFLKSMNSDNKAAVFDDQPYKFWWALDESVQDGAKAWIRTERRYDEFKRRLDRSRWFTSDDRAAIDRAWQSYWDIERQWLVARADLEASRSVLKDFGIAECLRELAMGDRQKASQELIACAERAFIAPYR